MGLIPKNSLIGKVSIEKAEKLQFEAVSEKMSKEEKKKKSWKERQRERQIKQQRAQEAYQIQKEKEAKRKPRKWPKGKIVLAVLSLIVILGIYGLWQLTTTSTPTDNTTPVTPTAGYIVIMPDGTVNPSNAPINVENNRYTFTADIYNPIIVARNDIVIDGANHLLNGTEEYNSRGIDLTGRSRVTITNMKIRGFDYGVYLSTASHNVISQNVFTSNYCGIWIADSSNNNVISGNNITNNKMYAIWLKGSLENTISENTIMLHANYTIYMRYSNKTTISANYIKNNNLGIFIYESSDNILYHNSFIDNGQHVSNLNAVSVWDKGQQGNYWSDYKTKYPDAEEVDASGIWNTPYVIDETNQDNYPLVNG